LGHPLWMNRPLSESGIHQPAPDVTATQIGPSLRRWRTPTVSELPKLTALTLASAIGGGGGTGGGGSTVFGILLAIGVALGAGACSPDRETGPGHDLPRTVTRSITCHASVAEETIDCVGPQAAPLVIGGQGLYVELRSRRARYRPDDDLFTFEVRIENLSTQTIGTDGVAITGVKIFFQSGPTVTGGDLGAVMSVANEDGLGTFTGSNQPYYAWAESLATAKTSTMKVWELNIPDGVTSFVFSVLVSAEVPDPNTVLLWLPIAQFNTHDLTGIAANSATDAMAVGINGRNLRKTANGWTTIATEFLEDWLGIQPAGGGKYIGATKQGTVAYFDGKGWQPVYEAAFTLTAFGGSSIEHLAVGGNDRVAWTPDDTTWTVYTNGALGVITGIIPFHADSFIAVSVNGDQVLVAYADAAPVSVTGSGLKYRSAFGRAGTVYGAAAYNSGPDSGSVVSRSGAIGFQAWDTFPDAVEVLAGGELWMAARKVAPGGHTVLMSKPGFTPGGWSSHDTVGPPVTDLKSDGVGGLYLVDAEGILRWNGSALVHELFQEDAHVPTALAAKGLRVIVGTDAGLVQYGTVDGWVTYDPDAGHTDTIIAAGAFGTNGAWVVDDDGRVYEFDGTNWSQLSVLSERIGDIFVWDHDHAVLVGHDGTGGIVEREVNGTWNHTSNPGGGTDVALEEVWGTSVDDFWIVGEQGKVVHYTGGNFVNAGPATTVDLHAIAGWSSSNLWIAGDGGYIAHWNGTTWTECTLGTGAIRDLWSPVAGVVYAASDIDGPVISAPGCLATRMRITGGGGIQEIAGDANDRVWAFKDGVVFRGHD
jgi:hypothetical protein